MDEQSLENKRDQQLLRKDCVDLATRVVGKPIYTEDGSKLHDDVVKVARKMYEFVKNG